MVQRIAEQLQAAQLPVKIMREPDSQNDLTARAIRRLTQDPLYPMSTRTEVLLYNAARSQSLEVIRHMLENGVTCLVDRSYLTTLAIQYYGRGDVSDYKRINEIIDFAVGDMQPDMMMVLDAPVNILKDRVKSRYSGDRFDNLDESFLERVRAGYLWEAKQRNLPVVYANEGIETVFKHVWQLVTQTLAIRDKHPETSQPESIASVLAAKPLAKSIPAETHAEQELDASADATATPDDTASAPWTKKADDGSVFVTDAGRAKLAAYTTNVDGNIYGFTREIEPITIAAAMARLSRRADDMRVTLLDEFIDKADKDEQLLHRVITAYGDDSVQQLVGQHFVVEGASVLLTKKLEWGRLASYLEQSTRYIYFDQKDADGHYRYYVPPELKGKVRSQYIRTMNQIFELYSGMVKDLTDHIRRNSSTPKAEQDAAWRSATKAQACDAIRDVLPLATKATVGIFASGQAFESLVMHLLSDDLPEAQTAGQSLLEEGRKVMPVFLERADKPDRGGATIAYYANTRHAVQDLAQQLLPNTHTPPTEPVSLVSYTPHNELDIAAEILYDHSDLPLHLLQQEVSAWPYQQKVDVLQTYVGERLNRRHRPGRALEKIHYNFDLIAKYGAFKDLQRHRMVDAMTWQEFTPRLGYDIPKLVEEAGLVDPFEQCFELSLELHGALQASQGSLIAQYAVLHGHNVRWKVTMNARESFQMLELRSSPQGHPAYRKLAQQMHEKIAEVHPRIAEAMTFMNQGEDAELARLSAERYTQFKLQQLSSAEKTALAEKRISKDDIKT
jgi:thymidylate synthase ThyX/thymidylate kinase